MATKQGCPAPFLMKTHQMVEDARTDEVISWSEDRSAFVVWKPVEFARDLLPLYFKHSNFSSFVRQLNTYGFRKVVSERWEFANDNFLPGEQRLLSNIQRRKKALSPLRTDLNSTITTNKKDQLLSNSSKEENSNDSRSSMSSSPSNSLWLENEKLKTANKLLCAELELVKQQHKMLLEFLSKWVDISKLENGNIIVKEQMDVSQLEHGSKVVDKQVAATKVDESVGDQGFKLFGVCFNDLRLAKEKAMLKKRDRCEEGVSSTGRLAKVGSFCAPRMEMYPSVLETSHA